MGRMLEALKRVEEPKSVSEPGLTAVCPEPANGEADGDEEMPFIEVGDKRKPTESKLRLEVPPPRPAALHLPAPLGAVLHACPAPAHRLPRLAAELVTFHQPEHAVSLQYSALFEQLIGGLADESAGVLVFSGLTEGAGATTAVLNTAIAGCRQHAQRIVVVDANLRRPAAAARLGVDTAAGLTHVLEGKVALDEAIQPTPVNNLHVLAAGTPSGTAGTPVAPTPGTADGLRWVLNCLRQRFDVVLVDGPACQDGGDLPTILPVASVVYLVMDAAETEQPAVRVATRAVARLGSRVGGLVAVA